MLLENGTVDRTDVVRTAAASAGLEYVDLADYAVDMGAAALLPGDFARRSSVLPLRMENGELVVAVSIRQAGNIELKDDLSRMTKRRVRFAIANRTGDRDQAQPGLPGRGRAARPDLRPDRGRGGRGPHQLHRGLGRGAGRPVRQPADQPGHPDRASDIHIEPTEHDLRVRYRIDGVLHDAHRSPKNIQNGVISRLKIMSDMTSPSGGCPQDGRMSVNHQGRQIDLRVATLPTVWGEKIVPRILDNTDTQLDLQRPRLQRATTSSALASPTPSPTA